MSTEKTFTIAGTSITPAGVLKVRWANDLASRVKILVKAGHTDIVLSELPTPMTKLAACEYLLANTELTAEQEEVVSLKVNDKTRASKRADVKATITKKVKGGVDKNKQPTDPKVEKFISTAKSETSSE